MEILNGLIMGNYVSLFFAEMYSAKISLRLKEELEHRMIISEFSYFSDDFFFFCNKNDNQKIINVFDEVLEEFNLERSDDEVEVWTYLSYNQANIIEKYWKKIISESKSRYDEEKNTNKLYFTNQLIYRISQIKDEKMKKYFLIVFFKSTYFYEMPLEKYMLDEYNYHQLFFIFRYAPETLIYSIKKLTLSNDFQSDKLKKFLKIRYEELIQKPFNDEQLYFYYAIKILNFDDILSDASYLVKKCKNQILISYYLMDKMFTNDEINYLKTMKDEKYWFQNYHLILFSDLNKEVVNSIEEYLVPRESKTKSKKTYIDFYEENLKNGVKLIRTSDEVSDEINKYLWKKIAEKMAVFGHSD